MLSIKIQENELWDERNNRFVYIHEQVLKLEHSLISLQKWESKWHKPFLKDNDKTEEELIDYIKCMTINTNPVPEEVYLSLNRNQIEEITSYINNPMTAAVFYDTKHDKHSREIITAETLYYDMISLNIPPEYRKWHLNQLMALIRFCSIKNTPPKKMSKNEILSRNAELNRIRRQQLNTKG